MVTQKLPQEFKSKQSEIQILEETISNPNISREYLKDLQEQVKIFVKHAIVHMISIVCSIG